MLSFHAGVKRKRIQIWLPGNTTSFDLTSTWEEVTSALAYFVTLLRLGGSALKKNAMTQ
jgi:hypothetical protein